MADVRACQRNPSRPADGRGRHAPSLGSPVSDGHVVVDTVVVRKPLGDLAQPPTPTDRMEGPSNLVAASFALCGLGASLRNLDCLPSGGIAAVWSGRLAPSIYSALDGLFHKQAEHCSPHVCRHRCHYSHP
jgi:hypothetical protein